jgi:hypothetical protein
MSFDCSAIRSAYQQLQRSAQQAGMAEVNLEAIETKLGNEAADEVAAACAAELRLAIGFLVVRLAWYQWIHGSTIGQTQALADLAQCPGSMRAAIYDLAGADCTDALCAALQMAEERNSTGHRCTG